MYVFINPIKPQAPKDTPAEITYEFAQKEIAQAKGFKYDSGGTLTKGRADVFLFLLSLFISVFFTTVQVQMVSNIVTKNTKWSMKNIKQERKKESDCKKRQKSDSTFTLTIWLSTKQQVAKQTAPEETPPIVSEGDTTFTLTLWLWAEQQVAQEQILEILPMVSEVNAISEELNKHKSFEVVLISAAAQEGSGKGQGTQYVNLTVLVLLPL